MTSWSDKDLVAKFLLVICKVRAISYEQAAHCVGVIAMKERRVDESKNTTTSR